MRVVITGASSGIGKATALLFLISGHKVFGIDKLPSNIDHENYVHYQTDVCGTLPSITDVNILINNAGVQNEINDIEVNLMGTVYCTNQYGLQPSIKAIVNVASTSAHNGAEFPLYAASKGAVLAYTKHIAQEVAKYGATCNSISPGGVQTRMNDHIMKDSEMWKAVLDETLLNKWATADEVADWIYFISAINKSMTGQDIIVDNGELSKFNFVW